MAFHDLGADAKQNALGARLVVLLRDGKQSFFERQARLRQGRQLPGNQCEFAGRDPSRKENVRLPAGFLLRDLGDADRQQFAVAQNLPHMFRRIAFEQAFGLLARLIHRNVFERTHLGYVPPLVFAGYAQHFFERRVAFQNLATTVGANAGLVLRAWRSSSCSLTPLVNHLAHLVVDGNEFVNAGAP